MFLYFQVIPKKEEISEEARKRRKALILFEDIDVYFEEQGEY